MDTTKEFNALVKYLEDDGYDRADVNGLVVNQDKVLLAKGPEGVEVKTKGIKDGLEAEVRVKPGLKIPTPIHMCFGVLPKEGRQVIKSKFLIGEGAEVSFLSHCIFPNAVKIEHLMEGEIVLEKGARMEYLEQHIHNTEGEIIVKPKAKVKVGEGAYYSSEYNQKAGRAGKLDIDYVVDVAKNGSAYMTMKAYGMKDDEVNGREEISLNGEGANGIIKTRVVLKERSKSEVWNITKGNAAGCRGHVDCTEIILDQAVAKAVPLVQASHPKAKVTHEAAIGSVDSKQLTTLMARGLDEDQAIDVIVGGMLAD